MAVILALVGRLRSANPNLRTGDQPAETLKRPAKAILTLHASFDSQPTYAVCCSGESCFGDLILCFCLAFRAALRGRIFQGRELIMKNTGSLPLLFLGLCLSALASAQADIALPVTTDVDCNWKLDGQPMGLLKADISKIVAVSRGEHLIEAASTDGLAKIRTKVEVDQGPKMVEIRLKTSARSDN